MAGDRRAGTFAGMLASFPLAWFLLALPFVSAAIIAQVQPLRQLATKHNWVTWPVGLLSLAVLLAGLMGRIPAVYALPMTVLAGLVAGYSVFWSPRTDSGNDDDDDDGHWRPPPPEEPPPQPIGEGPDWDRFDRLRRQWERPRVPDYR